MPAPDSFFDLFRGATSGGQTFVHDYGQAGKVWTDQLKQSRVFYLAGYAELARMRPAMDNDNVLGHFSAAKMLLNGWEEDIGAECKALGADQPQYARAGQPVTPENAALLIRAAESFKNKRGAADIYESIRIEACVYVLTGFREECFKHVPQSDMQMFREAATRYLDVKSDVDMSFVEADLAEGLGVIKEVADLAVQYLGPHCRGLCRDILVRKQGNTPGASLNLRFRPGSPTTPVLTEPVALARVTVNASHRRKLRKGASKLDGSRPSISPFSHSLQY